VSVQEFRAAGYLPEALRNYLALLGWGHDAETTFFSTEDLIEKFRLDRVSRSPAVFDEQKLRWMNGHYIRGLGLRDFTERLRVYLDERSLPGATDPRLEAAAAAVQEKISTLSEFNDLAGFVFGPVEMDERAWKKVMEKGGAGDALARVREALAALDSFDQDEVEAALRNVVEQMGTKPGAVFQPVRVAVSGKTVSAGVFESLALLGKEESLARIDSALARLAARST
jgi:glutamyl-tRNA synthetase